jgi:hypothetical protein
VQCYAPIADSRLLRRLQLHAFAGGEPGFEFGLVAHAHELLRGAEHNIKLRPTTDLNTVAARWRYMRRDDYLTLRHHTDGLEASGILRRLGPHDRAYVNNRSWSLTSTTSTATSSASESYTTRARSTSPRSSSATRCRDVLNLASSGEPHSKIDFSNWYMQFPLAEKSQWLTATQISDNVAVVATRMLPGLHSAGATAQRFAEHAFKTDDTMPYLDDVITRHRVTDSAETTENAERLVPRLRRPMHQVPHDGERQEDEAILHRIDHPRTHRRTPHDHAATTSARCTAPLRNTARSRIARATPRTLLQQPHPDAVGAHRLTTSRRPASTPSGPRSRTRRSRRRRLRCSTRRRSANRIRPAVLPDDGRVRQGGRLGPATTTARRASSRWADAAINHQPKSDTRSSNSKRSRSSARSNTYNLCSTATTTQRSGAPTAKPQHRSSAAS